MKLKLNHSSGYKTSPEPLFRSNIWFTADLHFNHTNIVKGISTWEDEKQCRDFKSLEDHNEQIIMNLNTMVHKYDHLFILGDIVFGGDVVLKELLDRIECENIYLVFGNHDEWMSRSRISKGFTNFVPIISLFKEASPYIELTVSENPNIEGQKAVKTPIVLSHYAMRVWNRSHRGTIMLHGHSHGNLVPYKNNKGELLRQMDVGIDTHPELMPYSFLQIKEMMKDRPFLLGADHHNLKTN